MTSYFNKKDALTNLPAGHLVCNRNIKEYFHTSNHQSFLDIIKHTDLPCFYEFVPKHSPVNLFFDIEIHKSKHPDLFNADHDANWLVNIIREEVTLHFDTLTPRFIILEAHNDTKKSLHIVVRLTNSQSQHVYFSNVEDLKFLVQSFTRLQEYISHKVVDTSVYREGLFRTIHSSKIKENRPLVISALSDSSTELETFVCYTPDPFALYTSKVTATSVAVDSPQDKPKELTTKQKADIKKFIKNKYGHNPKIVRDIFVDHNYITVSLNETYCEFVERDHQSNHQYIIIDTYSTKQKCHDSDCKDMKHNEIKMEKYPNELLDIVKSCLTFDNKEFELIEQGRAEVTEYIKRNFDDKAEDITFDKNNQIFSSNVNSNNLVGMLRGQCKECQAAHEIDHTGYCVKCIVCKSVFPVDSRIATSSAVAQFFAKFTQLVNNGTINNVVNIYNSNGADVDEGCEVPLDMAIFNDPTITSLASDCLDGFKINQLANLLHKTYIDHVWTGDTWYYFNGSTWSNDPKATELKRAVMIHICNGIYKNKVKRYYEQQTPSITGTKVLKSVKAIIKKLNEVRFKEDIIKEGYQYYEDLTFTNKLNMKKHLVPFTNGVFDLLSNTFRSTDRQDYVELTTGYKYDTTIDDTEVQSFLMKVLPNPAVREYVLKKFSECLNGDIPNTHFLMFIGDGANGKTQLLNLMKATMGGLGEKVEVTLLTRKRNDANEANTEKIKLMNKRFAFLSEPEDGEKINIGLLKELTGSEEIVARGLYQGSRTFVMEAKLFLACNELPNIKGEDSALWRRIRVIDFPSRFVEDPSSENEFKIDKSLPSRIREEVGWKQAFMNILLQYYYKDVKEPDEVKFKTNEYREDNNDYETWLKEHIEYHVGGTLKASDVCSLFFNGQPKISNQAKNKFYKEVEKYIKTFLPDADHNRKDTTHNGVHFKGWLHVRFKTLNPEEP